MDQALVIDTRWGYGDAMLSSAFSSRRWRRQALRIVIAGLAVAAPAAFVPAAAHPVAFRGATQITAFAMEKEAEFEAYHTFARGRAAGMRVLWLNPRAGRGERLYAGAQFNLLARRWNLPDAQANVYVMAGAGLGLRGAGGGGDREVTKPAGILALQADIEDRQRYAAVKLSAVNAPGAFAHHRLEATLGFAPYKTDFDEIQPWFMIRAKYTTQMDRRWDVAPVLRILERDWMIEAGATLRGAPFLMMMVHF
jgi:hypothetical protein